MSETKLNLELRQLMDVGQLPWNEFAAGVRRSDSNIRAIKNFERLQSSGQAFWQGEGLAGDVIFDLRRVCRKIRKADDGFRNEALVQWRTHWHSSLPRGALSASSMTDLASLATAYEDLRYWNGASLLGPTAAAKFLWAVDPDAAMPWDEQIRGSLGFSVARAGYGAYLETCSAALRGLCESKGVLISDLPAEVERVGTSAGRLLDEFLWSLIARDQPDD